VNELQLGGLTVAPPVILAPMAGVTNAPFRILCRRYGAGLYVSEMIGARALVDGDEKTLANAAFAASETERSIQLYGTDPVYMGQAVRLLVDEHGVDHIDMNFGCPVPKVTRHGGGAALPWKIGLFSAIVDAAVRNAGSVPVTVKFRLGIDDHHLTYLDAGLAAESAGAAAIALHARTAEQRYSGTARWEAIAALKETVGTIPVLGNGDIWTAGDALRMIAETGCDGVVVGRGCLGRPWLFGDLAAALTGDGIPEPPSLGEVGEIMRLHVRLLVEHFGPRHGTNLFRRHPSWYLKGFPVGSDIRDRFSRVAGIDEVDRLVELLDPTVPFPPAANHMVRGHSGGPRSVRLPFGYLDDRETEGLPREADLVISGG
jgi:nifR3 family TIM-barrel protein